MLMRSKLFVPASRPELFDKALAGAADAVSFDLEDAVAKDRKDEARDTLASYLSALAPGHGKTIVVRVNGIDTPHFAADLGAVVGSAVNVINLPMVEDPATVIEAATALDRLETSDHARTGLLVNIESPKGLRRAAELATAHPRVMGLQIGYADLMEPCGIDRRDAAGVAYVRMAVRIAAAEGGVAAWDGAFPYVNDPEGFRIECEATRRQGFAGKSCIHPTQIDVANAAFMPSSAQIERARRMLSAAADAEARGVGAFVMDGQMIDEPFLSNARAIVDLADRLALATKA